MGVPAPQPLAVFRLYARPDDAKPPSSLYALVQVWPSQRAMHRHCRSVGLGVGKNCRGTCTEQEILRFHGGRAQRKLGIFCEINLSRSALGMRVVCHEMLHATIAWARRSRYPLQKLLQEDRMPLEERLAYVHGNLCADFVRRSISAGLYRPTEIVSLPRRG